MVKKMTLLLLLLWGIGIKEAYALPFSLFEGVMGDGGSFAFNGTAVIVDPVVALPTLTLSTITECSGSCMFGSPLMGLIRATDDTYTLNLVFDPSFQTFQPQWSFLEWSGGLLFVRSINTTVPEASTFVYLMLALPFALQQRRWLYLRFS